MGSELLTVDVAESPEMAAAQLIRARQGDDRWLDRFADELDRRRSGGELARVLSVWRLSKSEAARLFGVSRQALGKWVDAGVPVERAAAVADLGAATDLLVRRLKRERIPAVVRRPFDRADGRSLVELVAEDPAAVLAQVRAMFDFAAIHG